MGNKAAAAVRLRGFLGEKKSIYYLLLKHQLNLQKVKDAGCSKIANTWLFFIIWTSESLQTRTGYKGKTKIPKKNNIMKKYFNKAATKTKPHP